MSEELILTPCPFCNSHSGEWRNHDKGCWFRVNEEIGKDRTPQSKEEMSKAWNTRPALDGDKECEWKLVNDGPDFDDYYETDCGSTFMFPDGTWHENDYRHCPKCSLKIKEKQ